MSEHSKPFLALTGRELVCAVDVLLRVAFPYPGSLPKAPFFEAPWVSIQCVQGICLQGEQELVSRDLVSLIELEPGPMLERRPTLAISQEAIGLSRL